MTLWESAVRTRYLTTEAVVRRCSVKKVFLKISQNSKENTGARVSFLIKLQTSGLQLYHKKKTLALVFSCEFCEVFKNALFIEHFLWLFL